MQIPSQQRVVITGTGAVTPLGHNIHAELVAEIGELQAAVLQLQDHLPNQALVGSGAQEVTHFSFRGAFAPRSATLEAEEGNLVTELSGAFAGRLVWSAAWGAFVSGAIRLRVEGRVRGAGPGGAQDARVTWDRTIIHQVRP